MPANPRDIDLKDSVYISGPHHVLHNMTEGFDVALVHWHWFVELLKHACRLIKNRWTKHRLLEKCFSSGVGLQYAETIRSFSSSVYDKRWGTAAAASTCLLEVLPIMHLCWVRVAFEAAGNLAPVPEGQDDESRAKGASVQKAH